ncbi:MAG: hemerythrin domain-containing protein [Alphaproteobacteria bacterium]|nr:hemerythrin domain-containing protein [Alphaproteobacteria bacterium]
MTKEQFSELFEAFKEDHAILGRRLHELSTNLRIGDLVAAKICADRLDREAGAHIGFEERCFYPALRPLLGDAEVERLLGEHRHGLRLVEELLKFREGATQDEAQRQRLIRQSEILESHIVECGELFGAMGRLPPEQQRALYRELLELRSRAPRWTDLESETKKGDA